MPRSNRGGPTSRGSSSSPGSFILPFALTLGTAAIATAGLYLLSGSRKNDDKNAPYASASESETEPKPRRSARPPGRRNRRRSYSLEHDRITEEDTDTYIESKKEEEAERLARKRGIVEGFERVGRGVKQGVGRVVERFEADAGTEEDRDGLAYGSGGTASGDAAEDAASISMHVAEDAMSPLRELAPRPQTETETEREERAGGEEESWDEKWEKTMRPQQPTAESAPQTPERAEMQRVEHTEPAELTREAPPLEKHIPPPPNRVVAIVLPERKATQGHESDEEFEEAIIPVRSLLSRLPQPLPLNHHRLYILIHSPHLSTHPLKTTPAAPPAAESDGLLTLPPNPVSPEPISPSLAPAKVLAEDSQKSTFDLAKAVLDRVGLPHENILPFTDVESIVPMLRALEAGVVYVDEALLKTAAKNGEEVVDGLVGGGAVGRVVVVVGGAEELGALAGEEGAKMHWQVEGGVRERWGGRVEVLEASCVEEDWARRIAEA